MKSSSRRGENEWIRDIQCDCWETVRPTWNLSLWLYLMVTYFLQLCSAETVCTRQRHRMDLIMVLILPNEYTKKRGTESEQYLWASKCEWLWKSSWIRREQSSLETYLLNIFHPFSRGVGNESSTWPLWCLQVTAWPVSYTLYEDTEKQDVKISIVNRFLSQTVALSPSTERSFSGFRSIGSGLWQRLSGQGPVTSLLPQPLPWWEVAWESRVCE